MSFLGNISKYSHRIHLLWLALILALALDVFAWINSEIADAGLSMFLAAFSMLLLGAPFMMWHKLRFVRLQRDQALAQLSASEWQMCAGLKNKDSCVADCAALKVHLLQKENEQLRAAEMSLRVRANHDDLTGLANRILLADRFLVAVERAKRSNQCFSLLMIDLNDFKAINDNFGHAAGDAVLLATASRLTGAVRSTDTVARLGGDEFVLIIESTDKVQERAQIGRQLIEILSKPVMLDSGEMVKVGASLGLALYPNDGDELNDLLHIADLAMYECKSTGHMSLQ